MYLITSIAGFFLISSKGVKFLCNIRNQVVYKRLKLKLTLGVQERSQFTHRYSGDGTNGFKPSFSLQCFYKINLLYWYWRSTFVFILIPALYLGRAKWKPIPTVRLVRATSFKERYWKGQNIILSLVLTRFSERTATFNCKKWHFHQVQQFCTPLSSAKWSGHVSFNALNTQGHSTEL